MKLFDLALFPALTMACFGVLAHALFLAGSVVPSWTLPACAAMAALWLVWRPFSVSAVDRSPASRTILVASVVLVLGIVVWASWTSCITPDRSWDGLVSWTLRAEALGAPADLSKAFFKQPEVFAHSRAYPLLQPGLLALLGDLLGQQTARLLFPFLFLSLFVLILATARRMGVSWNASLVLATAFSITPGYLDVGAGAIDSGYGDLCLAYAVALGAAGLLLEDSMLLFLACLLLPWIKPEGTAYAILIAACLVLGSNKHNLRAAAGGLGIAFLLWLPLRARLSFAPTTLSWLPGLLVLGLFPAVQELFGRWCRGRVKWLLLGCLALGLALAAFLGRSALLQSTDPLLRDFASHLGDAVQRIPSLPAMLLGWGYALVTFKAVGFAFVLLIPAFFLSRDRLEVGGRRLWAFLLIALGLFFVALLLSPEHDVAHELRSRLSRLLLQIVPVAWLLVVQAWALLPGDTLTSQLPAGEGPHPR